jgi:hypothetical protein
VGVRGGSWVGRGVGVDMFYTRYVIGFGYARCIYFFLVNGGGEYIFSPGTERWCLDLRLGHPTCIYHTYQ